MHELYFSGKRYKLIFQQTSDLDRPKVLFWMSSVKFTSLMRNKTIRPWEESTRLNLKTRSLHFHWSWDTKRNLVCLQGSCVIYCQILLFCSLCLLILSGAVFTSFQYTYTHSNTIFITVNNWYSKMINDNYKEHGKNSLMQIPTASY